MPSFRPSLLAILVILTTGTAYADTRPHPTPKRSYEETKRLMQLGEYLRCSFSQKFLLQTKDGLNTPDNHQYTNTILFNSLSPQASSSSDFATYSLFWENQDFDFYFYMNSQVGEIKISNKRNGMSTETPLDLSDFAKEEVSVGSVKLIKKEDLLVTNPQNHKEKVPGERYTYLTASCQFLEGYVP